MNKSNTFAQTLLAACFVFQALPGWSLQEPVEGAVLCRDCETTFNQARKALKAEEPDKALSLFARTLEMAQAQKDSSFIYKSLIQSGFCHEQMDRPQEALKCFLPLLHFSDAVIPPPTRIKIYDKIGAIYYNSGIPDQAFHYYLAAEEFSIRTNDTTGQAMANYQMGRIFFSQGQLDKARERYEKSLAIGNLESGSNKNLATYYTALGSLYEKLGNFEQALGFNTQALAVAYKTGNSEAIPYILHNIGTIHLEKGDRNAARNNLEESLKTFNNPDSPNKLSDSHGKIGLLLSLAKLENMEGRPSLAVQLLEEGLALARAGRFARREAEVLKDLAVILANQKNQVAATYLNRYAFIQDSLYNAENNRHLELLTFQREIEKVAADSKQMALIAEKDRTAAVLKKNIFLAIALGLAAVLSLLIYFIRLLRKSNALLANRNDLIQQQNEALEQANQELKHFASVASHDLKEPLRTISNYSGLISRKYKNLVEEDDKTLFSFMVDAPKRMQRLLEDLVKHAEVQFGQAPVEKTDLADTLAAIRQNLSNRILESNATVEWEVNGLNLIAVPTQLEQLFQNLVGNGIKFRTEAPPHIRIRAEQVPNGARITVSDNGIGIDPEFHKKIFGMFTRLHGRDQFEGSGIGLATCKKIVERHGGQISIDSTPGQGSKFILFFPAAICVWERVAQQV